MPGGSSGEPLDQPTAGTHICEARPESGVSCIVKVDAAQRVGCQQVELDPGLPAAQPGLQVARVSTGPKQLQRGQSGWIPVAHVWVCSTQPTIQAHHEPGVEPQGISAPLAPWHTDRWTEERRRGADQRTGGSSG